MEAELALNKADPPDPGRRLLLGEGRNGGEQRDG